MSNKKEFKVFDLKAYLSIFLIICLALFIFGTKYYYGIKESAEVDSFFFNKDGKEGISTNVEIPVGVLTIPKADQKLTIYNIINDINLDKGVVLYHRMDNKGNALDKSELSLDPKINKKAILVGHSGTSFTNRNIFLNVPDLKKGDLWEVNTGNQKNTYKLFDTKIVDQKKLEEPLYKTKINKSNNPITILVTCVSEDGVADHTNTHRLLSYGELVDQRPADEVSYFEELEIEKLPFWEKMDSRNLLGIIALVIMTLITSYDIRKRVKKANEIKKKNNDNTDDVNIIS